MTTDTQTGVLDENGLPVTVNDIVVDDELTAVGFVRRQEGDDDEDDDEDEFTLNA